MLTITYGDTVIVMGAFWSITLVLAWMGMVVGFGGWAGVQVAKGVGEIMGWVSWILGRAVGWFNYRVRRYRRHYGC